MHTAIVVTLAMVAYAGALNATAHVATVSGLLAVIVLAASMVGITYTMERMI